MNQESLDRANAFLSVVASRTEPGEISPVTPAEVGKELGFGPPLVAARAVRALVSRKRIEQIPGDGYRLLDPRPVAPGEPESVIRPRRPRKKKTRSGEGGAAANGSRSEDVTYGEFGREVVDRVIDLGREVGELRGNLKSTREEARDAREAKADAERRAVELGARVRELEARAEMAESNLRTLLATARGAGRGDDAPVAANEMEAILGVLKGDGGAPA
ncbi:MAG: hypothetical protein WD206_08795 [Actinomycetota bacterium]